MHELKDSEDLSYAEGTFAPCTIQGIPYFWGLSNQGALKIWSLATGEMRAHWAGVFQAVPRYNNACLVVGADRAHLVQVAQDETVTCLSGPGARWRLEEHSGAVHSLIPMPLLDQACVILGSPESIALWNLDERKCLWVNQLASTHIRASGPLRLVVWQETSRIFLLDGVPRPILERVKAVTRLFLL